MARYQNTAWVLFGVCILQFSLLQAKIFSKSMNDFRIFQEPHVNKKVDDFVHRLKRDIDGATNFTTTNSENHAHFHSQNSTLSSTEFVLPEASGNHILVHWSGENSDIVYVVTRHQMINEVKSSRLWRSDDYGETFSKIELPQGFMVNHILPSSADKSRIVFADLLKGELFITKDSGKTWKTISLHFLPYKIVLHKTYSDLVLAYDLRQLKLYVSNDFCQTWLELKERVTERFFFGVEGVDNDTRTVHMELQDPVGPVTYFACIAPNCTPVPVDTSLGTIDFYSLVVEGEYMFVQKSVGDVTSLYVSHKRGPFKKAFFPSKLHQVDFNVVDTSDSQVFIAVDHEENIANLYLSDVTGQYYVTSMENVVGLRVPGKYDVDIVKVKGLKGVYLCNKFEAEDLGVMSQRTYITFNKGGSWELMAAPKDFQHMCVDPNSCNLHLHLGLTNTFLGIPMAVTIGEAPGLILAHGSVGTFLNLFVSHVFVSRDAGLTWTAAPFVGNYFLNILDQGSVISAILAEDGTTTNQVHYSNTEGHTWMTYNFTKTPVTIAGVVTEPGSRSLVSTVFGSKDSSYDEVMIKLDYSPVLTRKCEPEDFEQWSPSATQANKVMNCLMGETVVHERRKQMSECFVGEEYFRPKSSQPCPCTEEDFECDFGFELVAPHTCARSSWFNPDDLPAPSCENGKYNRSTGYRRVASSSCEGGQLHKYSPVEEDCPLLAPRGLSIYCAKTCIQRGKNVTFTLTQESGSEEETVYMWSFGNGSDPVTVTGLQNAAVVMKSFHAIGHYNVTVVAVNRKGRAEAVLPIHVEDEIRSILLEIPWGARTGMPTYFNVTVLIDDNSSRLSEDQSLHFAWQFENKFTPSIRQLTEENVIQQEFPQPGKYTLTLNVFNAVSSVYYKQTVDVYEDVTTVRLHFSEEINNYNSETLNIRQALAEILCHNIAQILMVRRSRIIMSVPPRKPTVGDVTVLPPNPDSDELETYKVVQSLIDEAKTQYLSFPLFTADDIVSITDAGILDLRTGSEETSPPRLVTVTVPVHVNVTMVQERHSLLAVYISLPIVVAVIVIAAAVIIYYKKKLRSHKKYYPIVKHRSRIHHDSTCSCGEEDILGLGEPEDIMIPDNEYPDNEPTLMILNEPIANGSQRPSNHNLPRC